MTVRVIKRVHFVVGVYLVEVKDIMNSRLERKNIDRIGI